jgi:lipoprotein NlpI
MNSFDLILQGNYEEGIKQADISFNATKWNGEVYNKIIALLNLGKYTDAYNECKLLLKLTNENQYYVLYSLCCSMLSLHDEAMKYLELDMTGKYTDVSNGLYTLLFMYYINKDKKSLSKKIKKKNIMEWPVCLAGYILDKINEDTLLHIGQNESTMRNRDLCKCYFYIYCKNMEQNKKYLSKIMELSGNAILEPEYYLAKYEMEKTG